MSRLLVTDQVASNLLHDDCKQSAYFKTNVFIDRNFNMACSYAKKLIYMCIIGLNAHL